MLVSDDAGQTFRFSNFNIPGALDPTLIPLVQPGTFEDCGNDGGLRLAIVQGNNIGGGQFGLPRFVQSSRLTIQPALAVENGNVFLAYNASDSPFFGDPLNGGATDFGVWVSQEVGYRRQVQFLEHPMSPFPRPPIPPLLSRTL